MWSDSEREEASGQDAHEWLPSAARTLQLDRELPLMHESVDLRFERTYRVKRIPRSIWFKPLRDTSCSREWQYVEVADGQGDRWI